jgi:hypothetical protein
MLDIKARFNNTRASVVYHGGEDGEFCTCGHEAICANPGHKTIVGTIVSCQPIEHIYQSTYGLRSNLLCKKKMDQKWFRLDYVKGLYTQCRIMQLSICDRKLDPSKQSLVKWTPFEKVLARKNKGDDIEVVHLKHKLIRPKELFFYAALKI